MDWKGSRFSVQDFMIPSHITAPQAPRDLFDEFGVNVDGPRFDRYVGLSVSLEKRGLTSQISEGREQAAEHLNQSKEDSGRTLSLPSKSRAQSSQVEFWERLSIYTESIVAKLDAAARSDVADQIRHCHTEVSYRRCRGCNTVSKFYNRCEKKWCPLCAPRLSRERKKALQVWCAEVKQPKHVVLTMRNSAVLTKETVKRAKKALTKLRRSVFAKNWRGGFYSTEVTNESRGWHIHFHLLVDAGWIPQDELAREWAKCVGQDFAIVYVKDARQQNYLAEVAKYVVKGSELAKWSGEEIAAFVDAFDGVRTFSAFGSLLGQRKKVREIIKSMLEEMPACECGCSDYEILSPNELEEFQLHRKVTFRQFPPRQQFATNAV